MQKCSRMNFDIVVTAVIIIWLSVITIIVVRLFLLSRNISKSLGTDNLMKLLNKILVNQKGADESIDSIRKTLERLGMAELIHLQKFGLVKYNPFSDMGGDHSFSISLLNGHDSGFVLTGLHTRDRTRVYVKEVKSGKGTVELSEYEKKAVSKALKNS